MNNNKKLIISIMLGIYLSLVTTSIPWYWDSYIYFIIKTYIFSILLFKLIGYIDKINLSTKNNKITKKTYFYWIIYILIIMICSLIVHYPESFMYDQKEQLKQAFSGNYNDWHPVIHTFLFYRLPTLFIKSKIMCSLFQMGLVLAVLLYFCKFLEKYGVGKIVITVILSLLILNPTFDYMTVIPVKDTAYSYCIFLLTLYLINIYFTNGGWLKKKLNFIAFLVVCFGLTFFRHNGIGTFIMVLVPMIFILKNIRKFSILLFTIILSLRFIFVPFIYKLCNIHKVNFTFSEISCIMLNQLSYIYYNNGNISNDELRKLSKMQNLKIIYSGRYDPYNYDSIKFDSNFYTVYSPYINTHKKEFLKLYYNLIRKNKKMALDSYLYSTYMIWHVNLDTEKDLRNLSVVYFITPDKNHIMNYYNIFQNYATMKINFCHFPWTLILFGSGISLFLIIFSLFYVLCTNENKFKLLLIYLPVLTNLAMIFVILPGWETRFIYPNLICTFPLVLLMILAKNNKKIHDINKLT